MFVQYDSIGFACEQVLEFSQTPVYSEDGADYLYTHIRVRVRAVWNPSATYAVDGEGDPMVGAASIEELRHRLSQPRKVLKVRVPSGGAGSSNILVTSPMLDPNGSRYACDAKNGPFPIGQPVIHIIAEKTCIVDFGCETFLNECAEARPMLSHRWQARHDISRDYYTTRTIQGVAVFRTDVMERNVLNPDDFRSILLHPVPVGFKRDSVNVDVSSDNTTLRYTIVDEEKTLTIANADRGITRVEGTFTYMKGVGTASLGNTRGAAAAGSIGGPVGTVLGGTIGAVVDAAGAFPPATYRLNVRVWGQKDTTRATLIRAVARLLATFHMDADNAAGLGGIIGGAIAFFFANKVITIDIVDKFVEATVTLNVASGLELIRAGGVGIGMGVGASAILPPNPDVDPEGFTDNLGDFATLAASSGHAPKNDNGARGTYMAHLYAQALLASCAGPRKPDPQRTEKYNIQSDTAYNTPGEQPGT